MREILWIALGGAVGAVGRYWISLAAYRWSGDAFPLGTLLVNVAGCFLVGLSVELVAARKEEWAWLQPLIAVGLLGALTTFSTFGHETFRYLEQQRWGIALSNIGANMLFGLLAVWIGVQCGKNWFVR